MDETEIDWDAVMGSEQFKQVARRRRNTILVLGTFAAIYYFSISALIAWAPNLFKIRLVDGVNLGTAFAVSQYPFGGLITYVFMRRIAKIDVASKDLIDSSKQEVDYEGKQHAH